MRYNKDVKDTGPAVVIPINLNLNKIEKNHGSITHQNKEEIIRIVLKLIQILIHY